MTVRAYFQPVRRLAVLAALMVATLVTCVGTAHASTDPVLQGYWCGFTTSQAFSSSQLASQSVSGYHDSDFVDHCEYLQSYHQPGVTARTPVTFWTTVATHHTYLDQLRYNRNETSLFHSAYFSSDVTGVYGNASEMGVTMSGVFSDPWFFHGTLARPGGHAENVYAWWIGADCSYLSNNVWSACVYH